jgi:hypothetical protein
MNFFIAMVATGGSFDSRSALDALQQLSSGGASQDARVLERVCGFGFVGTRVVDKVVFEVVLVFRVGLFVGAVVPLEEVGLVEADRAVVHG